MLNNSLICKLINISLSLKHLPKSNKKHFSFIVIRNKIIGFGYNNGYKTHPITHSLKYRFCAIHSEFAAINSLPYGFKDYNKCKLINIRITRNNGTGISKPCHICNKYIDLFPFREIWYSATSGFHKL